MSRTPSKKPAEPLVALTREEAIARLLAGLPICEEAVRRGVAGNVNAPVEVLMVLAKDEDGFVRRGEPLGFSCRLHVCDIAGWGVRVAA